MTRPHTCHAIWCNAACPPAWLMCRTCWAKVSPATQAEVYRTVKLRDMRSVDASWAPWWRAQAQAIYEVALQTPGLDGHTREDLPPWKAQAWLDRELAVAAKLEAEG